MNDIHCFEPLWDEWIVDELLGEGSFGKVYKVHKTNMNTTYYSAVKHISIPGNPAELRIIYDEGYASDEESARAFYSNMLASLSAEINTMYQLRGYTNIVSYEDHKIIPKDDMPGYDVLIRMELLTSLSSLLQRRQDTEMVVRLGKDICSALRVLENRKLVHRDIKPQNIFVSKEGIFKLGDFGTARHMEHTTSLMSKKGTYVYMAPEVYRGQEANQTVDIYSLGLVLYRLLNGNRSPFLPLDTNTIGPQQNEEALARRMKGEVLPVPAYADERFAAIILKACAYAPQDRYQTAQEMYEALTTYESEKEYSATQKPAESPAADFNVETEATVGLFQNTDEKTTAGTSMGPVVSEVFQQKIKTHQNWLEKETPIQEQTEAGFKKGSLKKKKKKGLKITLALCLIVIATFTIFTILDKNLLNNVRVTFTPQKVTATPTVRVDCYTDLWLDDICYEIGNCTVRDFFNHGWLPVEDEFYDLILYPYEVNSYEYMLEKGDEMVFVKIRNHGKESCHLMDGYVYSIFCREVDSARWYCYSLGMPVNKEHLQKDGFQRYDDYYAIYQLNKYNTEVRLYTFDDFNIWTDLRIETFW